MAAPDAMVVVPTPPPKRAAAVLKSITDESHLNRLVDVELEGRHLAVAVSQVPVPPVLGVTDPSASQ